MTRLQAVYQALFYYTYYDGPVSTPRRQFIARRKYLGFTQEMLAAGLEVAVTSVARWEQGTGTPKPKFRRRLAEVLEVTMDELEQMLGLNSPAALNGHAVPPWLDHYASLEQGAARLQAFEAILVPGLLQTEEYAATVMRTYYLPASEENVRERVDSRMARKAVLDREPEPLELVCVFEEYVLHRVTGGPEVMAGQLRHLCEMATRPNIELRVIPSGGHALQSSSFGPFFLFTSAGATRPFIVCTEDLAGFNYQDRPQPIADYSYLFEHLVNSALSATESAELICSTAEDYQ